MIRMSPISKIARLSTAMLGICILAAGGASRAAADPIKVFVDGDRIHFQDVGPQAMQGRILVPVRGVLEKMGANVEWTPESQKVNCNDGDIDIVLHIGDRRAMVNGQEVTLDVPAQTIGGHTMVPLRFLSESIGAKVRWDAAEATVFIMTPDAGKHPKRPEGNLKHDPDRPKRSDGDKPRLPSREGD